MPHKEGSLEAPTRHPLDWQSDAFYDQAKLDDELARVFDICAGCRRCVSLCGAFPALFDLVDETDTGEAHDVDKASYGRVVDQCYLCDLCYMTKCPYVPPHPWNVDFPHLMLRAKAIDYRNGEVQLRDRVLSNTDALGHLAGIPVVTQTVNAVNGTKAMRGLMEDALGVDRHAWLPSFATRKFRSAARKATASEVRDGERTPGKVAIYATCYVNFNEPGIGHDLLALLDHNAIPYVLVKSEACCGMPLLEQGNLEGVAKKQAANMPVLAHYAREGYALLGAVPSCVLMYKHELPLMFPDDASTRRERSLLGPVRILRGAQPRRPAQHRFPHAAGQRVVSRALSCARAEHRPQDGGSACARARNEGQRGRALLGPRGHLRR
jgi:glycerol-3-phosphate dehydrogenase subunit C